MSTRFEVLQCPLPGLAVLQRRPIGDARGYLERMYCAADLQQILQGKSVVQINHTLTQQRGTVRGMHLQHPPHAETKLVSCLRGRVFDVALDLRRGSPTFLRWHAEMLTEDNHRTLVIPEGLAHGFQALEDGCEMLYLHTAAFKLEAEQGWNAIDPLFGIEWPESIVTRSERDIGHPMLSRDFAGIVV